MKPSFGASTLRIFELALGEMLWARRTLFTALIVAAPILLAVLARATAASGTAVLTINGERVGSAAIFASMMGILYVKFIVPAIAILYGTSLIADEVEDKTITYLFVRPIPRPAIVAGKYLAYLVCALSIVLPSTTIVFLLMVPFRDIAGGFGSLVQTLGALAAGMAAYGALFLLAGVALKRPLVAGLVFAFGWEQIALVMPGFLKYFTIAYYLQALAPQAIPGEDTVPLLQGFAGTPPSAAACLFWLFFVTVAALTLSMRTIERREYVLEQ